MAREKSEHSILVLAIIAIVAIVGIVSFFYMDTSNIISGEASGVDSAILDHIGQQNTAGQAPGGIVLPSARDCLHRKCDKARNQKDCVTNNWDVCN